MGAVTVSGQIYTLLAAMGFGVGYCLLYDVIRVMHKKYIRSAVAIFLVDVLYWLILLFFSFCFFLISCKGRIRGFVFLGNIIGFALCRVTVSRLFCPVLEFILKLLTALYHIIGRPFRRFFLFLDKRRIAILKSFKKSIKKSKKHLERNKVSSV